MAKKLVKRDERVVFFFGKKRRLDDNDGFKIGRMTVRAYTELVGRPEGQWYAELIGYDDDVTVQGPLARSKAAALKKLERRLEALQRSLDTICRESW